MKYMQLNPDVSRLISLLFQDCHTMVYTSIYQYTQVYTVYMGIDWYTYIGIKYTWEYTSIHGYIPIYTGTHQYTPVYMGIYQYTWVYSSIHTWVYTSIHHVYMVETGQYCDASMYHNT